MSEITINECTRRNTCYDCDNEKCVLHGKKKSDCPKYVCDMPEPYHNDCENCAFIDEFIDLARREYKEAIRLLDKRCDKSEGNLKNDSQGQKIYK